MFTSLQCLRFARYQDGLKKGGRSDNLPLVKGLTEAVERYLKTVSSSPKISALQVRGQTSIVADPAVPLVESDHRPLPRVGGIDYLLQAPSAQLAPQLQSALRENHKRGFGFMRAELPLGGFQK